MAKLEELEKRVKKLERPSRVWFILQVLLAPALVVWLGYHFDSQLQRTKDAIGRIEVAHQLVQDALSGNYEQSLITLRLVEVVLEPELADSIVAGVTGYWLSRVEGAVVEGRPEEAVAIVKAAERVGGSAGQRIERAIQESEVIAEMPERLTNAQHADSLTSNAFTLLGARRYDEALATFQLVGTVYPGYGPAADVRRILEMNLAAMDDLEVEEAVLSSIRRVSAGRVPDEYLRRFSGGPTIIERLVRDAATMDMER